MYFVQFINMKQLLLLGEISQNLDSYISFTSIHFKKQSSKECFVLPESDRTIWDKKYTDHGFLLPYKLYMVIVIHDPYIPDSIRQKHSNHQSTYRRILPTIYNTSVYYMEINLPIRSIMPRTRSNIWDYLPLIYEIEWG